MSLCMAARGTGSRIVRQRGAREQHNDCDDHSRPAGPNLPRPRAELGRDLHRPPGVDPAASKGGRLAMAAGLIRCEHCGRAKPGPRPCCWIPPPPAAVTSRCRGSPTQTTTLSPRSRRRPRCRPVDLWAPAAWAVPHRQPRAGARAGDLACWIKLGRGDLEDEAPRLAQRFNVRAVPTLLILRRERRQHSRQAPVYRPPCGSGSSRHSPWVTQLGRPGTGCAAAAGPAIPVPVPRSCAEIRAYR